MKKRTLLSCGKLQNNKYHLQRNYDKRWGREMRVRIWETAFANSWELMLHGTAMTPTKEDRTVALTPMQTEDKLQHWITYERIEDVPPLLSTGQNQHKYNDYVAGTQACSHYHSQSLPTAQIGRPHCQLLF